MRLLQRRVRPPEGHEKKPTIWMIAPVTRLLPIFMQEWAAQSNTLFGEIIRLRKTTFDALGPDKFCPVTNAMRRVGGIENADLPINLRVHSASSSTYTAQMSTFMKA